MTTIDTDEFAGKVAFVTGATSGIGRFEVFDAVGGGGQPPGIVKLSEVGTVANDISLMRHI